MNFSKSANNIILNKNLNHKTILTNINHIKYSNLNNNNININNNYDDLIIKKKSKNFEKKKKEFKI